MEVLPLKAKVILILLLAFNTQLFAQDYVPPIGIPAPEFGINEAHTMYTNAQYDFGSGLEPYKDAGNGPYTHYVDMNHPGATDTNNPYGTFASPRMTIPQNLSAGSVVEVHNGIYNNTANVHGGTYMPIINNSGTELKPIFIRGIDSNNRFEVGTMPGNNQIIVRDSSYLIMENMFINGTGIKVYQPTSHFAIRNSEITGGDNSTGINLWTWKSSYTPGDLKQHIVIYNNDIHDNGEYPATVESGTFGIMIDNATENVWVIDNEIYNNGDDGIQIIDRNWVSAIRDVEANRIFIGRNLMYEDGENAIDAKGSRNVIISQNEIYGYVPLAGSSAGEAIRINDEGAQDNIWIIYNEIYNSVDAIDPVDALSAPYVIGNIIHNNSGYGVNRDARVVTNNTFFNNGTSVHRRAGPDYELSNNIITESDTAYNYCSGCGTDVIYNNILFNNGTGANLCTDCINEDPLMIDPGNNNFLLQAPAPGIDGSPAIGAAGTPSSAYDIFFATYGIDIKVDFNGTARPQGSAWDIGAYESTSTADLIFYNGLE